MKTAYTQPPSDNPQGEMLIYRTEDGRTRIEVRFVDETVRLTQQQMAELFQTSRTNIVEHIRNIYEEGELEESATCRKFRQVRQEGAREVSRDIPHYNLDLIISLGYRVKSSVATQFRRWATERLREYIVKGFAMDDERLKNLGGGNYWRELLDRILSSTGQPLLKGPGSVSHKQAMDKALAEYRKFQVQALSPVKEAYLQTIKTVSRVAERKRSRKQ